MPLFTLIQSGTPSESHSLRHVLFSRERPDPPEGGVATFLDLPEEVLSECLAALLKACPDRKDIAAAWKAKRAVSLMVRHVLVFSLGNESRNECVCDPFMPVSPLLDWATPGQRRAYLEENPRAADPDRVRMDHLPPPDPHGWIRTVLENGTHRLAFRGNVEQDLLDLPNDPPWGEHGKHFIGIGTPEDFMPVYEWATRDHRRWEWIKRVFAAGTGNGEGGFFAGPSPNFDDLLRNVNHAQGWEGSQDAFIFSLLPSSRIQVYRQARHTIEYVAINPEPARP